jgi:hypothetical protein
LVKKLKIARQAKYRELKVIYLKKKIRPKFSNVTLQEKTKIMMLVQGSELNFNKGTILPSIYE